MGRRQLVETLFGQAVFSVGSEEYCWEDVVLAAELWGEWALVRDRLRQGLACLRASEEREDCPEEPEIESAATEFRYSRDLVSAQDMEAWLARWKITAEDWMDYVRWSLLRQKWSEEIPDLVRESPRTDDESDRLLQVEAVCSGDLERLAGELAGRAAVREREKKPMDPGGADLAEILRRFPAPLREKGLAGIATETCRAKVERLASLELSFRTFREQVLTAERIAAMTRARRIEWTRLGLHSVSFPEEQMASEASLCVREDGKKLGDVADSAGQELRRETIYIEEMDPALRDRFLGAQKGELLGPLETGGKFVLYQVQDRVLPSENDASVAARAQEAVLKLHLDREINDRVKWVRGS